MDHSFFVVGGIYTSTAFEVLEPGAAEVHGPFASIADAEAVWQKNTQRHLDICCHRLFIVQPVA